VVSGVNVATKRGRGFVVDVTTNVLAQEQPVRPGYQNYSLYDHPDALVTPLGCTLFSLNTPWVSWTKLPENQGIPFSWEARNGSPSSQFP
jgi:hypothetical protein